jgi:hypothetical protein
MQALAGLCLLLFVAIVTVVGVRMLLLARRTQRVHERLIGAGMVLIGGVGFPGGIASGFGASVGDVRLPVWFAATLLTQIGILLIYAFTWQVFRPTAAWGRALVGGAALLLFSSMLGAGYALAIAPADAPSTLVARTWLLIGMIGYCGCFVWSAIEGFVHWRDARRRLALGLADAVVVNRFLLWALFGIGATGINVASGIGAALGLDPSKSAFVLVPMGVLGFFSSVAMYLAFLPPAAYLERIRASARTA